MRLVSALFLLAIAACGKPPAFQEPELANIAISFGREGHARGFQIDTSAIEMRIREIPGGQKSNTRYTVGICSGDQLILIDPTWFRNATGDQKEQRVFHELGHCALGRAHLNAMGDDGLPVSIMNVDGLSDHEYLPNRTQYIDELFTRIRD